MDSESFSHPHPGFDISQCVWNQTPSPNHRLFCPSPHLTFLGPSRVMLPPGAEASQAQPHDRFREERGQHLLLASWARGKYFHKLCSRFWLRRQAFEDYSPTYSHRSFLGARTHVQIVVCQSKWLRCPMTRGVQGRGDLRVLKRLLLLCLLSIILYLETVLTGCILNLLVEGCVLMPGSCPSPRNYDLIGLG